MSDLTPIQANLESALSGVLMNSPAGQVVDDLITVLGTLGLLEQAVLSGVETVEAKFGFGPDVSELLKSKLTSDGAHIAQVQADGLEAAKLALLAGSKP